MNLPEHGWKNVVGSSKRNSCSCGSEKNHWIIFTGRNWPKSCSIKGCNNAADRGLHMRNPDVHGERIIPGCAYCNINNDKTFILKSETVGAPANKQKSCDTLKAAILKEMYGV